MYITGDKHGDYKGLLTWADLSARKEKGKVVFYRSY